MKNKKLFLFLIPLIIIVVLAFYFNGKKPSPNKENSNVITSKKGSDPETSNSKSWKIGILTFNMEDELNKDILEELNLKLSDKKKFKSVFKDGKNDLDVFKKNLDSLISEEIDGLLISTNNFESVSYVNKQLSKKNIASIFFNQDIRKALDKKNKQTIFMGPMDSQAYVYQGELAFDLWNENQDFDRNNDGILQYMKIYLSTDFASGFENDNLKVFTDNDLGVKEVLSKEVKDLDQFDNNYINKNIVSDLAKTELIFTNDDSLSVKLIDYLNDRSKKPAIIGMRASELSRKLIANKKLAASVGLNSRLYADHLTEVLLNKLEGRDWTFNTTYKFSEDDNSIILDNEKITN